VGGYKGHKLERFLVRVLFCLFADDTGIFEPDTFKSLVEESREDGSDLGPQLDRFFRVLDTPEAERSARLPETLQGLPYVNGQLFAERLDLADFDFDTRNAMRAACRFQWAKISPAVFGSLFQSIMAGETGAKKRRQIGAHYTSERDILKLIRSLFLDDLRAEFDKLKPKRAELLKFHDRLAKLKFLDPACGCGNFLVVAYRELRRLEHEVIDALFADHALIDIVTMVKLNVDQMHGIEIEEWPARIAEVGMWLIDHQMNLEASQRFGKPSAPPAAEEVGEDRSRECAARRLGTTCCPRPSATLSWEPTVRGEEGAERGPRRRTQTSSGRMRPVPGFLITSRVGTERRAITSAGIPGLRLRSSPPIRYRKASRSRRCGARC
jgi:hypothetical protein